MSSNIVSLGSGLEHVKITERHLLERFFLNMKRRRGVPFWVSVRDATGHGSNVCIALCREFCRDPETGAVLRE